MRLRTTPASRIIATALAAALCSTSVAFAAPADATQTPAPAPAPAPKPAPKPAPTPSIIPVPTDPGTTAFRLELERRQAALDAFKAQLDQLDRELGIASEQYNAATEDLALIQERLDATHQDLGASAEALTEQQKLLETRVTAMYRDGQSAPAEILLGATSIPDFLQRLDFVRTISSADADLAKQLSAQRDQISKQSDALKASEIEARGLEFALKARKIEIELRVAERQGMMSAAQNDLLSLLDSEAARRSGEELVLWHEIMA